MDSMTMETNALGQDKVARYGWTVTSEQGEFRSLNKRLLHVNNDVYQRDGIKSKVLELASNWSWIACGALTVAQRDGVFWVVDGQHRKLAADRRSDIKELPCLVFQVGDIRSEARAFLDTNTNRKPVTALAKFKAQVAAGNPVASRLQDIIVSAGLRLASASQDVGDFKSVALAMSLTETDPDGFCDVIHLAAELAKEAKAPVQQRLVSGLYYLHTNIDGGVTEPRLRQRIKQVGLDALVKGADKAASYYAKGGAKVYADGMLQAINHGLRNRFELANG